MAAESNPEVEAGADPEVEAGAADPEVEVGAGGTPAGVSFAPTEQYTVIENNNDDYGSDDEDDVEVMYNGDRLLDGLEDHFSLPKASCLVRSRNKASGVRVYDPGFGQQIVLEETYDENLGHNVEVRRMSDVTVGHRLINTFYAIVAALFSGFLFVFFIQVLLFMVLNFSIEGGLTSDKPDVHLVVTVGILFAIIGFSQYFAEAMVIAGQFIADAYQDHPLSRTFILKGNKNGHVIIEWLFHVCFLLCPTFVGCIMLLAKSDRWWYYTAISWFFLVMGFFVVFCFAVIYYEVGSAYSVMANFDDTDSDHFMDVLKRAVLLRQTQKMSGHVTKKGIARNVFLNSEATDKNLGSGGFKMYKKSEVVNTPIWTRLVSCMPSSLFVNLTENPKTIYTIPDIQDYRPFLTRQTWSLERIFCRPEPSRYIAIVRGPGSLTLGQLRSSVICSVLAIIMLLLVVAAFLVWFGLGIFLTIVLPLLVFMVFSGSIRNTYNIFRLGRDVLGISKKKKQKEEQISNKRDSAISGESQPRRSTLRWQTARKTEESEAVFHVSQLTRHYEATETMCWISLVVELVLFFVFPAVVLLVKVDTKLGLLFFCISIVSNIRWYINIVSAIQKTGNMDLVGGDTPDEIFENKARLNDIVVDISANPTYNYWRALMGSMGLGLLILIMSTLIFVIEKNETGYKYLPFGEFKYPGAAQDMRYPTCTLDGLKGGFGNKSTMLDFAWLSANAYFVDNATQTELDNWFFEEDFNVTEEQEIVEEFLDEEDPKREKAVKFKLISLPGPEEGQKSAIVLIRGTVNQFDIVADFQLWTGAVLFQLLRGIFPVGEIWTEIFPRLVKLMNAFAGDSIERVSFYKLTTSFVDHLKKKHNFDHIQLTGHSLGGGLALITGAQEKIPAIGVSAPNARISGLSFQPPITEQDINNYGFNIIPKHDIIAKVDDVADNWQQIACTADLSTSAAKCHTKARSICELMYTCGSGNRPVFCECVKDYNYPKPIPEEGVTTDFDEFCGIANTD